jgi:hypothetical protein
VKNKYILYFYIYIIIRSGLVVYRNCCHQQCTRCSCKLMQLETLSTVCTAKARRCLRVRRFTFSFHLNTRLWSRKPTAFMVSRVLVFSSRDNDSIMCNANITIINTWVSGWTVGWTFQYFVHDENTMDVLSLLY